MQDINSNGVAEQINAVRDLADFCQRWPEIRKALRPDHDLDGFSDVARCRLIFWFCELTDRVCVRPEEEAGQ